MWKICKISNKMYNFAFMKSKPVCLYIIFMWLICQPCFADGYLIGDMNGDGILSIADITDLIETVRKENRCEEETLVGDINQDGWLAMSDITLLSNVLTHRNDTIKIYFKGKDVFYLSPYPEDSINVSVFSGTADAYIANNSNKELVFLVQGESDDGRIYIDSKTEYKLILNGISLTSTHAPAFNSVSSEKVKVNIADNTTNTFCDASKYSLIDSESASGCFNSMGQMTFSGDGTLTVKGKNKHAIYCKKSITINNGSINVDEAASDALHSGKHVSINGGTVTLTGMDGDGIDLDDDFTMTGGILKLDVTGDANKGVKCGGIMDISGGAISATASGALKNKDGDLSYCTILKCDSCMTISGGDFHLINDSPGGKCISADQNLTIAGGTIYAETNGDGAEYTNADGEIDYYTAKCIAVDDSMFIDRGSILCLSTGVGGKGIAADEYMQIGLPTDTEYAQGPIISIETTNSSIVNDVEEDQRYGCPKAIKVNDHLNIYSGDIHCATAGMGGEGVECNNEMYVYGGSLECNCYDDGMNIGQKLVIDGGQIYCNSIDNDGIDSNGIITINDGIVTSINQKKPNESFDSQDGLFYINGGTVFGIGSSQVEFSNSTYPIYNTKRNLDPELGPISTGLTLTRGMYVYIMHNDEVIMAIRNDNSEYRSYITYTSPILQNDEVYSICEGTTPLVADKNLFGDKVYIGGKANESHYILDFMNGIPF